MHINQGFLLIRITKAKPEDLTIAIWFRDEEISLGFQEKKSSTIGLNYSIHFMIRHTSMKKDKQSKM